MDMLSDEVVASPCRNVCRLDDENVCEGCRRTIDEIARWIQMSNAEKKAVLARIEEVIE